MPATQIFNVLPLAEIKHNKGKKSWKQKRHDPAIFAAAKHFKINANFSLRQNSFDIEERRLLQFIAYQENLFGRKLGL